MLVPSTIPAFFAVATSTNKYKVNSNIKRQTAPESFSNSINRVINLNIMIRNSQYCRVILRNLERQRGSSGKSILTRTESTRTIYTNQRLSCTFNTCRNALATEATTSRYIMYAVNGSEQPIARGWDDLIDMEEDDGT